MGLTKNMILNSISQNPVAETTGNVEKGETFDGLELNVSEALIAS